MGADLYIKNLPKDKQITGFEVSDEARASGYFRDCYNEGGLFAVISSNTGNELSWWATASRKSLFKQIDDEFCMTVKGAEQWLAELKPIINAFVKLPSLYYSVYNVTTHGYDKGKDIEDSEVKEYRKWAKGLIKFLELAIKLKSPIIWSV